MSNAHNRIVEILGDSAEDLLTHKCETISADQLHLPGPDFVDRIFIPSDRSINVLRSLQTLFGHGRMANSGYISILPVDQGIEHSAAASFAPNPLYFDPENIVRLGLEAGCNGVASTLGVLGSVARKYAHKIPFILKLNHNELLSHPNFNDQTLFSSVEQAREMGCVAVGATVYWGSLDCRRQLQEISEAFEIAHDMGMATILWCYLRNSAFKVDGVDYHGAADLTGQANHLGVTIKADIIKQKMPTTNLSGYRAVGHGRTHDKVYNELSSDHPIDQVRYQVANCYMGRMGLINSGGASGSNDIQDVTQTAVINKRAGGMGLIVGRKAFQRPFDKGIELLQTLQDVYLDNAITVA